MQEAIEHLGRGFLSHRSNGKLREGLCTGDLSTQELYREIRALRIYEGATEVQQLIIARELLKGGA